MIASWLNSNFTVVIPTNGNDLRVNCPFCRDTKQHLYVSEIKSIAHCFKCDWAGSYFSLISEVSGAETALEIWQELKLPKQSVAQFITVADRVANRRRNSAEVSDIEMPEWYKPLEASESHHSGIILNYALKRLSISNLIKYGFGYCADSHHSLALRLVIPVERGYWQARTISQVIEPKYINPESDIGNRLFNYKALELYPVVIICEGVISAIAAGANAVATLSNKATPEQLARLGRANVRTYILAYDAGQEHSPAAMRIASALASKGKQVIIRAYEYGDPDSCGLYTETDYSLRYYSAAKLINNKPVKYRSSIRQRV